MPSDAPLHIAVDRFRGAADRRVIEIPDVQFGLFSTVDLIYCECEQERAYRFSFWTPVVVVVVDPTPPTCCQQSPAPESCGSQQSLPPGGNERLHFVGFVQRSRLEREVGRDLHSNKWEEV